MKQKTGFEFEIQRAKWGPFNGLRLEAVDVGLRRETKTFAQIARIIVEPDYSALLKGQLKPVVVEVISPSIEVELESLRGFLKSEKIEPTHIASVSPKPKVVMNRPKVKAKFTGGEPLPPQVKPGDKRTPQILTRGENRPKTKGSKVRLVPFDLRVRDISFRAKLQGKELLLLDQVSVELPTESREGYVMVGRTLLRGKSISEDALLDLTTDDSGMVLNSKSLRVLDCPIKIHASLTKKGIFLGNAEIMIEEGVVKKEWGRFAHQGMKGKCFFGGVVQQPKFWKANWQFLAQGLSMSHPAKSVKFERANLVGTVTSHGCDLTIARFVGDELSVVANGFLASDGEVDAKFRVVATEDEARNVGRFAGGLKVHFPMLPMDAPDQFFNDIAVRGKLWDMEFKSSRRWKNLKKVLKSAKTFLKAEGEETLKGE